MTTLAGPAPLAYTIEGAARALQRSRSTVYGLIRDGFLETKTIAGQKMIPAAALLRLVENGDGGTSRRGENAHVAVAARRDRRAKAQA